MVALTKAVTEETVKSKANVAEIILDASELQMLSSPDKPKDFPILGFLKPSNLTESSVDRRKVPLPKLHCFPLHDAFDNKLFFTFVIVMLYGIISHFLVTLFMCK